MLPHQGFETQGFETWSAAETPLVIEYAREVIESIRRMTREGLQSFAQGGNEAAGVLWGTHEGNLVRVNAVDPIACDHAQGPTFQLSDSNRDAFIQQLTKPPEGPGRAGLVCVGWFISHTGGQIALTDSDAEVFSGYFTEPWQVTMVVRPGRGGNMRAGFFMRDAEGNLARERSYREFDFPDRLGFLNAAPPPDRRTHQRRAPASTEEVPRQGGEESSPSIEQQVAEQQLADQRLAQQLAEQAMIAPEPAELPTPTFPRGWPLLVAGLLVAAAIAGFVYFRAPSGTAPPPAVDLLVLDREGQLQIQWNRRAPAILDAAKGSVEIVDGIVLKTIPMSGSALAGGSLTYERVTGEVEVHLAVETKDGEHILESSRYLGSAPMRPVPVPVEPAQPIAPPTPTVDPAELDKAEKERAALQAEVRRLRNENKTQGERVLQLERVIKLLESRMAAQ